MYESMNTNSIYVQMWTPPKAAAIFGLKRISLESWIKDGLVPLARPRQLGERGRQIDLRGMLAICLIKAFRQQNASLLSFKPVAEFLRGITVPELLAAIDRGETVLMSGGEQLQARLICPTTSTPSDTSFDLHHQRDDLRVALKTVIDLASVNATSAESEVACA